MRDRFPYKLAAIDIDQTLVGRDKRIGVHNREAVERLRELGCRVILASGRRHDNMLPYVRELGLDGYVVSTQGAVVRHSNASHVLHEALLLAPEAAGLVTEGLRRDVTVMHWSRRGVVANENSRWVERYIEDCRDPVTIANLGGQASWSGPAEKIVWGADPRLIVPLAAMARERYCGRFEVTVTDEFFLEFTALEATKAAGVAAVARYHNVAPSEVLAFGDGNNDASMLAWAGMGIAMPHGKPAAKAAAKMTAPAGDVETSLARAVDALLQQADIEAADAVGAAA